MKFFDWLLGTSRRKQLLDKIEQQHKELQIQSARLDRHIAALDGEKDWFNRVCTEHMAKQSEDIKNGTITTLTSLNRYS